MPMLKPKPPSPSHWDLIFGKATGDSSRNFYVLAYSPDLDEFEVESNPSHEAFTYILHIKDFKRRIVDRVNQRVEDIWKSPSGQVYAVGSPRGILEISPVSCIEVGMSNIPGTFEAIWGTGEDHIFACGSHAPFLMYRCFRSWHQIPLPEGVGHLRNINGFNEQDVYLVGDNGQILHFDGQSLNLLDSPTTLHLTSIELFDKNCLCLGGYDGVLLFGNKKGWRFIPTNTNDPLLSLARFQGCVCFGTSDGVWSFNGKVSPTLLVSQPARWVNSLGDVVMIVNGGGTWVFNGQNLTKLDTVL